jgi:hypothetical protein
MQFKRLIIIIVMLTSNIILFGQTPRQIDYFKILNLNLSDLQDYMIELEFEFDGTKKDVLGETYTWAYRRNRFNSKTAVNYFNFYLNNDGSKSFSFQSQNSNDYKQFKKTIKEKQLKFEKSENREGKLIERFSNSKYACRIWSSPNQGLTTYEMCLEKK